MKKGLKILLISVLLALVVYNLLQKLNESFNWFGGHPEITRTVNSISQVKDGLAPKFLIDKAVQIGLSTTQKENIKKLQLSYERSVAIAKKELDIQVKRYQEYTKNNKPTEKKIAELNKEISRISAVIVTTRAYYWNEACKILKVKQTKILDEISTSISPDERDKYR